MSKRPVATAAGVTLLSILALPAASFAAVPWSTPGGTTSKIKYSDGQSTDGMFGNPVVNGATLQFTQLTGLGATAAGGSAMSTLGSLSFNIATLTGDMTKLNVTTYGTWSVLGGVGGLKAANGLTVTRLDLGHWGVVYQSMLPVKYTNTETGQVFSTPDLSTSGGSGTWKAEYSMIMPAGTRSVAVMLDGMMQATSGSSAAVALGTSAASITAVVPEPASLAVVAVGGLLAMRRRRS